MKKILLFLIAINLLDGNSALNYVNSVRVKSGMSRLNYNSNLALAAKRHAVYLATNREFGHYETKGASNFFGVAPWDRVLKAGFGVRAVVEDISFYEPSFRASINKLLGTVYHRLGLLDERIDSIGYANYKGVYVYDMSSHNIAPLCNKKYSVNTNYVYNVCRNGTNIPYYLYNRALNSIKRRSKSLIVYPYPNAKHIPLSIVEEAPRFVYSNSYGFPITATFNSYYAKNIKLKKFILKQGGSNVSSKIVTYRNDNHKKLTKYNFVLLPLHRLKRGVTYTAYIEAIVDGKVKKFSWNFST